MLRKMVVGLMVFSVSLLILNCGTSDDRSNPLSADSENSTFSPDYGVSPDYIPTGNSDVGTSALADGSAARMALYGVPQYFWGDLGNGNNAPLVKITHAVSEKVVDMDVTFNPAFVDNTYGTGSVGWSSKRGHTFRDLYSSDHVQIAVTNGAGDTVWCGRLDLLSATTKVPSGYACLGPFGGDGAIYIGKASDVLSFGSSLDDNINYYGYELFENSPATDSTFKKNPEYPYWQYYVSFRLTLDKSVFGPSGYGEVHMTSVHASPSKNGISTIEVTDQPGPVPGSPEDPFRFFVPSTPKTPDTDIPDTTTVPVDTTVVPPDNGIGVD